MIPLVLQYSTNTLEKKTHTRAYSDKPKHKYTREGKMALVITSMVIACAMCIHTNFGTVTVDLAFVLPLYRHVNPFRSMVIDVIIEFGTFHPKCYRIS